MGVSVTRFLIVLSIFGAVFIAYKLYTVLEGEVREIPDIPATWWGPGQPSNVEEKPRPFKIDVPDEVLEDLKERLEMSPVLHPALQGTAFQYGFNSKYLGEVVNFWLTKYNWREREEFLNSFPQFKIKVQGLDIHYLHVIPKIPKSMNITVRPLLLLHGWPGSVREFYDIIPMLTTPQKKKDFVFEVIVPSLPGYGFSDPAIKPGLGAAQMAVLFGNFMKKVGHEKFYVAGGDWGSIIGAGMATLLPDKVLGLISTMCTVSMPKTHFKLLIGSFAPDYFFKYEHPERVFPLSSKLAFFLEETGYFHLQATKPDTIGVALHDSPSGLAAYILEKFSTWTNKEFRELTDGGLTQKFKMADLLDNVMIYWVSRSITTSMRLYSETINKAQFALQIDGMTTNVPTACVAFPNELNYLPESLLKDRFLTLLSYTHMPRGGHFGYWEEPELMSNDIWQFVQQVESGVCTRIVYCVKSWW